MSAKHTPGPWQQAEFSPTDVVAGDVMMASTRYSLNGIGKAEAIANARLIAAAPELLAALESLVNYANLGAYERADAMNSARAVIKKAKRGARCPA